jgi:hypothetical protein
MIWPKGDEVNVSGSARVSQPLLRIAHLPRLALSYQYSRAYGVILLEAGHFGQTFCLVATWLGLAPFCTAALDDGKIESDLDLNAGEALLYAAA